MKIIQTYQQGGRHKANQQPCEDRTYSLFLNGVSVIALADGAGSDKYTHSAQGAECVCETACKFFCKNFDKFYNLNNEEELKAVISSVCQNQLSVLKEKLDLDDIYRLSSTLLCVAVKDNKMIACHIGDGVIGKLTPGGTEVISAPEKGEFAGTTYFITGAYASEKIDIIKEKVQDTIAYFLMSDGTSDYIYDDFNKSFHDAARKMALLSLKSDGQEQLQKTVQKFMTNYDPKSDDCSFICLSLKEEKAIMQAATATGFETEEFEESASKVRSKQPDSDSDENIQEIDDLMYEYAEAKKQSKNRSIKQKKSEKKKYILIASMIVIVVASGLFVWGRIHLKNKREQNSEVEKTTISTVITSNTKEDGSTKYSSREHSTGKSEDASTTTSKITKPSTINKKKNITSASRQSSTKQAESELESNKSSAKADNDKQSVPEEKAK